MSQALLKQEVFAPMALSITPWSITSDLTPEIAVCAVDSSEVWVLSWLSERELTRSQAISGMALDEILSDPEPADGEQALAMAAAHAAELGLSLREVVVRLAVRVAQRDLYRGHHGHGLGSGSVHVRAHRRGASAPVRH
ncbi:hypothetical protein [Nocardia crassostreae]|uniref:hypothetical protein n=1 Tax=Nocardia crassostreae TaxID=53428 RepID=UPI0012FAA139|nr:hypothetical protein [Nocardia crassostreae]